MAVDRPGFPGMGSELIRAAKLAATQLGALAFMLSLALVLPAGTVYLVHTVVRLLTHG